MGRGQAPAEFENILSPQAVAFVTELHRRFNPTREKLLIERKTRQDRLNSGEDFSFLESTKTVRTNEWRVATSARDLEDRRVEITGPAERKMMINALNSGAKVFMADLEDSCSPTWENILSSQQNLIDAVRKKLTFINPDGKKYELKNETATLVVRPRGWHLIEKHFDVDGKNISASLFDFGLYFFHNATELLKRGSGPYFYLPKMESHLEARLWNDVFNFAQDTLKIPRGTIRATVLIETIPAAFEMEEILFELKSHSSGLNAGRWDYMFSTIKKFSGNKDLIFPDRTQITMTVPFMRAYTELLVHTCHKRGAHAIGGMAAFIPSRKNAEVNALALQKVREDKQRESKDGFDGTWVAHPDLVPIAKAAFDEVLKNRPHQKDRLREDVNIQARELTAFHIAGGKITEEGFRNNISVALQYLESWLSGVGAVGIFNLMEDAATAEISRAELWQWIHHGAKLDDGRSIDAKFYKKIRDEELAKLASQDKSRFNKTVELLDGLVLDESFTEFLTIPAYNYL